MNSVNRIDWPLFHIQKQVLLTLCDDPKTTQEECAVLEGVVNMMDGIQDDFEPQACLHCGRDLEGDEIKTCLCSSDDCPRHDTACPTCGADGGTSCGAQNCGY